MPKNVELADNTISRLQSNAEPLVDTFDTVIHRALDAFEASKVAKSPVSKARLFDAMNPPNLAFTSIVSIKFRGEKFTPNNWSALLNATIEEAMKQLKDSNQVKDLVIVNHVEGEKAEHGYTYIPCAKISVQGQNSVNAWKAISHIAASLELPLDVVFKWQDNARATHPGTTGCFILNGN